MQIKLWGTRGSLPRAMDQAELVRVIDSLAARAKEAGCKTIDDFVASLSNGKIPHPFYYGGHTTCSEVSHADTHAFVDMGTGITEACYAAMAQGRKEFSIFQTHLHWDHIMGMPFFVPIHIPGYKVTIYHVHANAEEYIRILFNGINFPVRWADLQADIQFKQIKLYQPVELGEMKVTPFALDHPGGSFGYRFDRAGKSVAIGVDGEYKRLTPKELGKDLPFYQNLDLLIFDAQYEMDELASRFDWGHSSPPIGVDLALREGIRNLVLTHHDPRTPPEKSQHMLEHARAHCRSQLSAYQDIWKQRNQPNGPNIRNSFDGLEIDIDAL